MNKRICISLLALLFFAPAQGQEKRYIYIDSTLLKNGEPYPAEEPADEAVAEPVPDDHTEINEAVNEEVLDTTLYLNGLITSPDSVRQWKKAKEYAYMKNMDSLLKDLQQKEKNQNQRTPVSTGPGLLESILSSAILKILLWTLAGGFVLFIVYRLFLADGVFRRESRLVKDKALEIVEEHITGETDFDALINGALTNNNFRQAVRYQYLRTLHKLAGRNFVELAPDKTNYQYVREIKGPALQNDFASLTLNYEYVWYGEFEVEKDIYDKIENGFRNFNQKV